MSQKSTMCERCDGLCCRVYDIIDPLTGRLVKRAGDKCGYLDIKNRCRIHETRSRHPGYASSCESYDCMEGGPIVTVFARRIQEDTPMRYAIISSLLETIRLRMISLGSHQDQCLISIAQILNSIRIDDSLMLSVKIARVKIERWEV